MSVFRWDWQRAQGHPAVAPSTKAPLLIDREIGPAVVQAIEQAQTSVGLEDLMFLIGIIDALKADVKRGVLVEVLLDPHQHLNKNTATQLQTMVLLYDSHDLTTMSGCMRKL